MPPVVASVGVTPSVVSLASLGESVRLTAVARDADGATIAGKSFTWSSRDRSIAVVSSDGEVTAVSNGTSLVTATVDGVGGSATVDIRQVVASLRFTEQPARSFVRAMIAPPVVVTATDARGGQVRDGVDSVRLELVTSPAGAALFGTLTLPTEGAELRFPDARLDAAGTGFRIRIVSSALVGPTSDPFDVLGLAGVDAGSAHTCATASDGATYCWGLNGGRFGNGEMEDRWTPVATVGGPAFAQVVSGRNHTCGRTEAGSAYCWGVGNAGALGTGGIEARLTPAPVTGEHVFATLSAGWEHTCGVTTEGEALCWGRNHHSQLGDGTESTRLSPTPVAGGHRFESVAAGRYHTCALTTSGVAYCWGNGGHIGDGTGLDAVIPVPVAGDLVFTSIHTALSHTCGVASGGSAYCWGINVDGQLGDGTTASRTSPVRVGGGLQWRSLATGCSFSCGITTDGSAHCWGANRNGQVGQPIGSGTHRTPKRVPIELALSSITAGCTHACATADDGAACCWGEGSDGRLGDGQDADRATPTRVGG